MSQPIVAAIQMTSLADVAKNLDTARRLLRDDLGRGLSRRSLSRSVLANLYEAVLGAVYLDAGLEATREFVRQTLVEPLNEVRELRQSANPKQSFQEHSQRRWSVPPEYEVLESRGLAHARAFRVRATVQGRGFPSAWGRTRKEAEHWAAYEALLVLEEDETS
jgi:ribonuclease-3